MADYIVKDTELTSVANAIRTAGGTNSLLSFPNGFVSAVGNISGGGSSDFSTAEVTLINNTSEPDVTFSIPLVYEGVEGEYPSASTSKVVVEQNFVIDAVLYQGLCNAHINGNFVLTGTGSVTIDGLYADITGDCTITATDPT